MATNRSLSRRILGTTLLHYALAAAAVVTALLVSNALSPWAGERVAYVLLLPAVAFSAWYCGIGPSILAIALALGNALYGVIPPVYAFRLLVPADLVPLLAFLFSSVVIVALGEVRRRHNEQLRKEQGELEGRVQERTADLDTANQNLRKLSARLLQLQDEERRRIARELHDSVGQMLAALEHELVRRTRRHRATGQNCQRTWPTAKI